MNWYGAILAFLLMANSALSLKCYIGDGFSSVDCSSLVANAKYCAKITIDFQGLAAHSCVAEPQTELGIDESSITQSLSCYERKINPLKGEYCFCSADNCNDRYASTTNTLISANGLKCYKGSGSSCQNCEKPKADTLCGSSDDRCYSKFRCSISENSMYGDSCWEDELGCFNSADICKTCGMSSSYDTFLNNKQHQGNGYDCIGLVPLWLSGEDVLPNTVAVYYKTCICEGDNCNSPTENAENVIQSKSQIFIISIPLILRLKFL